MAFMITSGQHKGYGESSKQKASQNRQTAHLVQVISAIHTTFIYLA